MPQNKYSITGLSHEEVKQRVREGKVNLPPESAGKSTKEIILSNTLTYFNFIFLVITVLLCVAGSFRNLTFLPIVIGNTLVGIIQELRAKKVLDKMNLLNAPHTVVIRGGEKYRIRSEELVQGDAAVFSAGDQICADARVIEGSVSANEALLTGEQDEVAKKAGDALLSGSFVVSGECCAVLEKVGAESYISKLTEEAKNVNDGEQSEMIRSINKIVKWMGIILIPIGAILFYQSFFVKQSTFSESIVSAVAAIIGMIPEGLYLLTTAALTLGTIRLAKRKVLLNDMKSIEALARVDVLCVDKTGTITEPEMQVYKTFSPDGDDAYFESAVRCYVAASNDNNATMTALKNFYPEPDAADRETVGKTLKVTPFSSSVKYGAVTFEGGTFLLGAPEFLLSDKNGEVFKKVNGYVKKGYRVLAFVRQEEPAEQNGVSRDAEPIGFAVLSNAIRKNAPKTFKYFKEQGVDIKVISGDNPETVSEIARLAGIENSDRFVDAATLKTPEQLKSAAVRYTVFGRVTPKQKQQLVAALQGAGHTVAMTGDGVNDILALKDADCGIAMASGSEAVSQAAQVVLLDSDFAHMPSVVNEGRRVVNNIQRSASLFLVKNIFSLLLSIMASVFFFTYPIEPTHISLISMFTIGAPGFFLALESNKNRIDGSFLRNVLMRALPAGLTDAVIVGSLAIFGKVFGMSKGDIATASTVVLAVVGFMILRHISLPFNKYRRLVFILNLAGIILCCVFIPEFFMITGMSATSVLMAIIFSFAAESLFRILTGILEYGERVKARRKKSRAARK
mgnify:FL=1